MRPLSLPAALSIIFFIFSWPYMALATDYDSARNAYDRRDYYNAFSQFSELADQGGPYAQFMLGKMYANGEGVTKDYLQAYKWLYLADTGGVKAADRLKKRIGKQMSKKKINKAKQLAIAWQRGTTTSPKKPVAASSSEIKDRRLVKQVQQKLKQHGYYFDTIDGVSGPGTRNAIMVYQHSKGVKEDGRVTESLLNLMGISPIIVQTVPAQPQKDKLADFQKRLKALIIKAKKRNAADPWLITELEQLVSGKTNPWPHLVFHEKFKAKGYRGGDAWRVLDGRFSFEPGVGLVGTANFASNEKIDDLALSLLDVLINQKKTTTLPREIAQIETSQSFSSAFALMVKTGPLQSTEGLVLSCTARGSAQVGYKLAFHPGQGDRAKLFRISGINATEIPARISPINFTPNTKHTFTWSRQNNGTMAVIVDGQRLLTAKAGKGSPKRFDTLTVSHFGSRVVFQEIKLRDTSGN